MTGTYSDIPVLMWVPISSICSTTRHSLPAHSASCCHGIVGDPRAGIGQFWISYQRTRTLQILPPSAPVTSSRKYGNQGPRCLRYVLPTYLVISLTEFTDLSKSTWAPPTHLQFGIKARWNVLHSASPPEIGSLSFFLCYLLTSETLMQGKEHIAGLSSQNHAVFARFQGPTRRKGINIRALVTPVSAPGKT